MKWLSLRGNWRGTAWSGTAPIREELFGPEKLEQHAETLAAAQAITVQPQAVPSLHSRLRSNASALLAGYRATSREVDAGRTVVPAAEWLLDNYHLVDEQIREIRDDLSPNYYRQLPKLAAGPLAGYPRVLGVAWAYVAHTDSRFDAGMLRSFISAYQRIQPLTIGELWAVAITLRIVLVENLRRLAEQIRDGLESRRDADLLADQLLSSGAPASALAADALMRSQQPLCEVFSAQLVKRLRDQDPRAMPALGWLEERLAAQGASIDGVVEHAQQRLGASNVSVRNVITSMRLISDIDWTELFESMSLVDERLRTGSDFGAMDFPTRNLYRDQIEQLARGSGTPELQIVLQALAAATGPAATDDEALATRDPGYHLLGAGRRALEREVGFRPSARLRLARLSMRLGVGGYIGAVMALSCAFIALALLALPARHIEAAWLICFAIAGFIPASEAATALVNRAIAALSGPVRLPGLELARGVPTSLRTLIAVPTMLTSEADILEQIERLEVHFLSGASGDLTYALLSDGIDAAEQTLPGDAPLLEVALSAVIRLNQRHGPGPAGDRFLLLHRHRVYNAGEKAWMGWERKRGKLHELNRLLRGAQDTSFMALAGHPPRVPEDVRYVITLDADTRLTRDAAVKLVGKMAHPMNRPRFSIEKQRVVRGYAILQPRVTPSLPMGREGSLFQRAFSGPGGTDPYAATVSDVYQDLFGEGSYIGKGIYDVDAFEAALAGRIPENTMLSHDLFEGVFARSGLAGDIEVVEDFPTRYDVAAKRQHRWIRGDWQLLPNVLSRRGRDLAMPPLGRLKTFDNLRRSLLAPTTLLCLGLCWLLPLRPAFIATLLLLVTLALPALLPVILGLVPHRRDARLRSHFISLASELRLAATRMALSVVFLADQAWRAADAIVRTLLRLCVTRRHLLEWTTAAKSSASPRLDVAGFHRQMRGSTILVFAMAALTLVFVPSAWPLVLPFALLWLSAPAVALWVSRPPAVPQRLTLAPDEADELRLIARRTWRYFETFVTPADNMLPPDNFQETPNPVIAHRTSPTNIGLYLLAAVAARDFGWAGTLQSIERLEATFGTLARLPRFHGHFLNWYGTRDLSALPPAYVSSVDSGNLAGHLIALANACEEWIREPPPDPQRGISDALALIREALVRLPEPANPPPRALAARLDELQARLLATPAGTWPLAELRRLAGEASEASHLLGSESAAAADAAWWSEALGARLMEHERDCLALDDRFGQYPTATDGARCHRPANGAGNGFRYAAGSAAPPARHWIQRCRQHAGHQLL